MNARALGLVKVWAASSFKARYASVSTITPEQLPQTSVVPTRPGAQTNGSLRKKSAPNKAKDLRRPASRFWKINRQGNLARHRFALAERRDEFRPVQIDE